jgi:hypothetical protein
MEDSLAAEPSVRKVDHPSSVWVNSAVLFREDLDKVISLMPKPIHISDKEHEYATLDDVRKTVGDTPRGLKIESGYPQRVSLTLENSAPWFVWLEGSSKEVARKAFLEIRDILECSRPKYSWMFAPATRIVLLSLTIIGLIAGGSAISQGVIGGGGWGIAIGVTSLALLVLSVAFDQSRFILVKEREYKRTHFFVRNRNKVTLVVVAAIATATITKGCDFTLSWINSKMNRPLGPAQNAKQDDGAKSKDASAGTIGPETTSPRKSR